MSKYPQKVTASTSEGVAEGVKNGPDEEWLVTFPWGDRRFYGSVPEVLAMMSTEIMTHDPEWEEVPSLKDALQTIIQLHTDTLDGVTRPKPPKGIRAKVRFE